MVELGQSADGYGPAVTFDNLVLLYNPQDVSSEPTKLSDLWAAPDNSIALPAPPDIQGIAFTALTADNLGVDHQKDVAPAIDELAKLAPKVTTWEPQPDVYQTITSGSASYGIGWNARGQVFADESDGRLAVVQPEDGIAFQINTINAVEGSKNAEAAKEFINYALSEEAQMSFAEAMFYAPTVSGVELPSDLEGKVAQPDDPNIVPIDWIWMADERDGWTDMWRRNVIGG
ncbi:MAG: extracellular solute-binding protein [Microbacteriaceae bacterium]